MSWFTSPTEQQKIDKRRAETEKSLRKLEKQIINNTEAQVRRNAGIENKSAFTNSQKYKKLANEVALLTEKRTQAGANALLNRKKLELNKLTRNYHKFLANRLHNIGIKLTRDKQNYKYSNLTNPLETKNELKKKRRLLRHIRHDYINRTGYNNTTRRYGNDVGRNILSKVETSLRLNILLKEIDFEMGFIKLKEVTAPPADPFENEGALRAALYPANPAGAGLQNFLTIKDLFKDLQHTYNIVKMIKYEINYIDTKNTQKNRALGMTHIFGKTVNTETKYLVFKAEYLTVLRLLETKFERLYKLRASILTNRIRLLCKLFKEFGTRLFDNAAVPNTHYSLFKFINTSTSVSDHGGIPAGAAAHNNATDRGLYINGTIVNFAFRDQGDCNTIIANNRNLATLRFIFLNLLLHFSTYYGVYNAVGEKISPFQAGKSVNNMKTAVVANRHTVLNPKVSGNAGNATNILTDIYNDMLTYNSILLTFADNHPLRTSFQNLKVAVNAMQNMKRILDGTNVVGINKFGRNHVATNLVLDTDNLLGDLNAIVTAQRLAQHDALTNAKILPYQQARAAFTTAYSTNNKPNPLKVTGSDSCSPQTLFSKQCLQQRGNLARKAERIKTKFENKYKAHALATKIAVNAVINNNTNLA